MTDGQVDILHSGRARTRNRSAEHGRLQEHGSRLGPTLPIKPRLV